MAGCGGAGQALRSQAQPASTLPAPAPASYHETAVKVRDRSISVAAFDRKMAAEMNREHPEDRLIPPDFTGCIARLKASARETGRPNLSPVLLKSECEVKYQEVRQRILNNMISNEWAIGGAHELGADEKSSGRSRH